MAGYWNKLAGLSPRSLLGGTFVANVAAGLGCGRTNVWACRPASVGAHKLQGKPIDVALVGAQQTFCTELRAYTGAPGADSCANRNFCKYATHMVQVEVAQTEDDLAPPPQTPTPPHPPTPTPTPTPIHRYPPLPPLVCGCPGSCGQEASPCSDGP